MFLYPYDILRLKDFLKISSQEFMESYTRVVRGSGHPYFPSVMLRLTDDESKSCPFLAEGGCGVYMHRPSACRTYPLERGVDRSPEKRTNGDFYFKTNMIIVTDTLKRKPSLLKNGSGIKGSMTIIS